jgi:hypothetical protein
MNLKQKIALVAIPAVLAIGAGMIAVQAAPVHKAAAVPAAVQTATDPTEPAESTTPEAVEANDPALPAGQTPHNDTGDNVDHQFDGVE